MEEDNQEENNQQLSLFDIDPRWKEEWQDMPEYSALNNDPFMKIIVNFKTKEDYMKFALLIEQNLTQNTDSIWYPKQNIPRGTYINE